MIAQCEIDFDYCLVCLFDNICRLKSTRVSVFIQDSESGLHRGFASLTFANAESAAAAVQQRPHVIDGDLVWIYLLLFFYFDLVFLSSSAIPILSLLKEFILP